MGDKITILTPEPIAILDADDYTIHIDNTNSTNTYGPNRRHRSRSSANDHFNFSKACVSESTIVKGDNGNKFAIWKITIFLEPSAQLATVQLDNIRMKPQVASPQINIYRRYSDFVILRKILISTLSTTKEPKDYRILKNILHLPPPVPWYDSWKYHKVNLDRRWLIERRIGLESFLNGIILNHEIVESCRKEISEFLQNG